MTVTVTVITVVMTVVSAAAVAVVYCVVIYNNIRFLRLVMLIDRIDFIASESVKIAIETVTVIVDIAAV